MTDSDGTPTSSLLADLLEPARYAEKEQALLYRALAARAEGTDPDLAQRFHDLHADEQHHLSRLTARILEVGGRPLDLSAVTPPPAAVARWEDVVRDCERREIERYRGLLAGPLDPATRALLEEILSVEQQHAAQLGGKWTIA